MRLTDLRVVDHQIGNTSSTVRRPRPATIADLIAALISEGGETTQSNQIEDPEFGEWVHWLHIEEAGRYLVFRIPEGTEA